MTDDLTPEAPDRGDSRRDLLKKAAVGGAVVWAGPTILSSAAGAQASPPPQVCTFSFIADWDGVSVPANPGYASFVGGAAIGATGFVGNGVDVVGSAFGGTPPWSAGQNWVDLVEQGTSGSMSATLSLPCPAEYRLTFTFSQYAAAANLTVAVGATTTGPIAAPAANAPATFDQTYSLPAGSVTITLSGTGGGGNIGPAVGDISFVKL